MYIGEKQEPIKIFLLSIVTCGIYGLIWDYKTGEEINKALGREAVNTNLVWISILCFPVILYYLYTVDQALMELGVQRGIRYDSNFVLWILLYVVASAGWFVAMFQTQAFLNRVWEQGAPPQYNEPQPPIMP
ncbi:MAG: DUF4234 domain-containing protein [Oscillospiraceae bacterium]|jgi:hypothetical protein|nr:DUF4234 domain-containing protein [Oscillospiraceae bacterium]